MTTEQTRPTTRTIRTTVTSSTYARLAYLAGLAGQTVPTFVADTLRAFVAKRGLGSDVGADGDSGEEQTTDEVRLPGHGPIEESEGDEEPDPFDGL